MEHNHHHDHNHQNHTHNQPSGSASLQKQAEKEADKHHRQEQQGSASDGSMHDKHAGHHTEDFLKRFWVCLILTIPVLLQSQMIQALLLEVVRM